MHEHTLARAWEATVRKGKQQHPQPGSRRQVALMLAANDSETASSSEAFGSQLSARMVAALMTADATGRVGGGWPALAKLLLFCSGASGAGAAVPGHFAAVSWFSKTSGRSFLSRRCGGDLLYVSDSCEHAVPGAAGDDDEVGAYRGVFRGFVRSRTRACLMDGRTPLGSVGVRPEEEAEDVLFLCARW